MLGHSNGLWTSAWPTANAELAKDDEVEVPVQINGKLRGKVKVAAGAVRDDVLKHALAEQSIAQHINGKRIAKVIYVPDKLLNLVVS
jgi:leucyl-tRNA synthetase